MNGFWYLISKKYPQYNLTGIGQINFRLSPDTDSGITGYKKMPQEAWEQLKKIIKNNELPSDIFWEYYESNEEHDCCDVDRYTQRVP